MNLAIAELARELADAQHGHADAVERVGELLDLLFANDLGRHCGYDYTSDVCPMTLPCWHHRRNAAANRKAGKP